MMIFRLRRNLETLAIEFRGGIVLTGLVGQLCDEIQQSFAVGDVGLFSGVGAAACLATSLSRSRSRTSSARIGSTSSSPGRF